jgi:hypothetical protein
MPVIKPLVAKALREAFIGAKDTAVELKQLKGELTQLWAYVDQQEECEEALKVELQRRLDCIHAQDEAIESAEALIKSQRSVLESQDALLETKDALLVAMEESRDIQSEYVLKFKKIANDALDALGAATPKVLH